MNNEIKKDRDSWGDFTVIHPDDYEEISDTDIEEQYMLSFSVGVCKFCHNHIPTDQWAHLHQGEWVGDCCFDERLRITE